VEAKNSLLSDNTVLDAPLSTTVTEVITTTDRLNAIVNNKVTKQQQQPT